MDMTVLIIFGVVALVGVGVYFFVYRKKSGSSGSSGGGVSDPRYKPPPPSDWTRWYGPGDPRPLTKNADGTYSFDWPKDPDGVHYIVKPWSKAQLGQTFTLRFKLEGDATFKVQDPADIPPAKVRCYMQRVGDDLSGVGAKEHYRQWGDMILDLKNGDWTFSIPIQPSHWSGVKGRNMGTLPNEFADVIANLAVIGFSMGGQYFAGHGVGVLTGNAKLTIVSCDIA